MKKILSPKEYNKLSPLNKGWYSPRYKKYKTERVLRLCLCCDECDGYVVSYEDFPVGKRIDHYIYIDITELIPNTWKV